MRTPFQRDRDRIVHSKPFRRLKHKTQVFVSPEGDHFRTRLTHTLEVTGISRTVARALRLNEDLTEAIGLGHDVGHPPFGHIGEDVLDRAGRERFGRGFRHNEHSLRVVDVLEGLNLTEPVRDGILRHSSGAGEPATLEGKIVRLVDRIAYINHDIDDALRAGVLQVEDLPVDEIAILGPTGPARIDTLVHDLVAALRGRGGHRAGRGGRARDVRAALLHVRARVPRAGATRAGGARRAGAARALRLVLRAPGRAAAGRDAGSRDRLSGGDDRSICHPRLDGAHRAAGPGALMARYTDDSRERVRDAVDFAELVGARTELRRAGVARLEGLCPFHDERSPSFGINPVEKVYYCFGCGAGGDVFKFVMETENLNFGQALESLAERYRVTLEREAEDPKDAEKRQRRERLLALLGAHRRLLRARAVGVARGGGCPCVPLGARAGGECAARVPRGVRAGHAGIAW